MERTSERHANTLVENGLLNKYPECFSKSWPLG